MASNYFTPEEEERYRDLEFRRERNDHITFFDKGIPMDPRHAQWLEQEKARKKQEAEQRYAGPSYQYQTTAAPPAWSSTSSPECPAGSPDECVTSKRAFSPSRRDTSSSDGWLGETNGASSSAGQIQPFPYGSASNAMQVSRVPL
jgi:hypothetical protein